MSFNCSVRAAAISLLLAASPLTAQDSTNATAPHPTPPPSRPDSTEKKPAQQAPAAQTLDFSGVIYANYQYGGSKLNRSVNRFDVERAYLNFRATAGERVAIRVTTDVLQQRDTTRDAYYRGWTIRAKYAYVQYDFVRGSSSTALKANARLGLVHTVVVDLQEQYWPRGLAPVALDQNGFFSSSDAGIATTVTLPNKVGEVYATITNGSNYTSRETDRFKDIAGRFTLSPFANRQHPLSSLIISPWFSLGERASDFAVRRGTVRPVAEGRTKNRRGLFLALRNPRATLGAELAWRDDVLEFADTTGDVTPSTVDRTGRVASAFAIVRPFAFGTDTPRWPIGIVLRADHVKPDVDGDPSTRFVVAGLMYDLNRRTSVTLDVQRQLPHLGSPAADIGTVFLHVIASF